MKPIDMLTAVLLLATPCAAEQPTVEQTTEPILSTTIYRKGDNGFDTYRIPATVRTAEGTILAFAEARKHSRSDTGDIDLVLRRSTDGGRTWGDIITVWDDGGNVCGNPAPVVDRETGRILLLSTWNNGKDHEKDIHLRTSEDTRRVFVLYSDDDGQHKGRIVVSANHNLFKDGKDDGSYSHLIYSDDHGQTWVIGGEGERDGNESTVAELKNGDLMLNMRRPRHKNHADNGSCRLAAVSHDQGITLEHQYYDRVLTEPVCNGSIINYTPKGKLTETLLFSNPDHPIKRKNMTVKISKDSGKTWQVACRLSDAPAAYSDMVVLSNGDLGVLYETGAESCYERIEFAILPAKLFK